MDKEFTNIRDQTKYLDKKANFGVEAMKLILNALGADPSAVIKLTDKLKSTVMTNKRSIVNTEPEKEILFTSESCGVGADGI